MRKLNHREKQRMARRMNGGIKRGAFITKQWAMRAKGIETKVKKRESKKHKV